MSTELSAALQLAAHISGLHGHQRFCSTSQESSDKYYMASLTSYLIAFNLERTLFFCTFILPCIIANRPDFAFDSYKNIANNLCSVASGALTGYPISETKMMI